MGTFVIIWILLIILVGVLANRWKRNGFLYAGYAIFLSPIISGIILLINGKNKAELKAEKLKDLKKCPYCAEYIKIEAKVCKHCGKEQPDSNTKETISEEEIKESAEIISAKLILIIGVILWAIILIIVLSVKLSASHSYTSSSIPISEEYTHQREILDWFTSVGTIQTTSADNATIRVAISLGYKKDDKATSTELVSNTYEIKDFIKQFLGTKYAVELKSPETEEKIKIELRNALNDKLLTSSKIRDVVFLQMDIIEN